jgi:hypothetical protein
MTTGEPQTFPAGIVSPDGRWVWDGTQWVAPRYEKLPPVPSSALLSHGAAVRRPAILKGRTRVPSGRATAVIAVITATVIGGITFAVTGGASKAVAIHGTVVTSCSRAGSVLEVTGDSGSVVGAIALGTGKSDGRSGCEFPFSLSAKSSRTYDFLLGGRHPAVDSTVTADAVGAPRILVFT